MYLLSDEVDISNWSNDQSYVPVCCYRVSDWSDACYLLSTTAAGFPDGRPLRYRYVISATIFSAGCFFSSKIDNLLEDVAFVVSKTWLKNWCAGLISCPEN